MIAYASSHTEAANSFLAKINGIILSPLILLLTAVAVLVFLWGVFQYIYNAGSGESHEEGRRHMLWGIIGLVIMVSAYAIIKVATWTFGIPVA